MLIALNEQWGIFCSSWRMQCFALPGLKPPKNTPTCAAMIGCPFVAAAVCIASTWLAGTTSTFTDWLRHCHGHLLF
jgi:hypothetical protein